MDIALKIEQRSQTGKSYARKLRAQNKIPGVIYSKGETPEHISVDPADFYKAYKEAGTTSVIKLNLAGEEIPALIREVQTNPVNEMDFLHVDFLKLDLQEKIRVNIPIVLVNRDNIKLQPSILVQLLDEIEVQCLPTDIPQKAEIDVREMDYNTPKYVRDTDVAKMDNVEVLTELDKVVCTLSIPSTETADTGMEEGEETEENSAESV